MKQIEGYLDECLRGVNALTKIVWQYYLPFALRENKSDQVTNLATCQPPFTNVVPCMNGFIFLKYIENQHWLQTTFTEKYYQINSQSIPRAYMTSSCEKFQ